MARRRERLGLLLDVALQVARIRQAPALVQQKLGGGNFLGALQLLRHAHAQLQSKQVEGISCLSSMAGELEGVRDAVHKMMGQEFLVVACGLFDGCMQRADARPFHAPPPSSAEAAVGGGLGEYVPSADDRRLLLVIAGMLHRYVCSRVSVAVFLWLFAFLNASHWLSQRRVRRGHAAVAESSCAAAEDATESCS